MAVSPTLATAVPAAVTEPLYYLHNFRTVLAWVGARYDDLLSDTERDFEWADPLP